MYASPDSPYLRRIRTVLDKKARLAGGAETRRRGDAANKIGALLRLGLPVPSAPPSEQPAVEAAVISSHNELAVSPRRRVAASQAP